ncbi:MAG TPA: ribose-5-phosphate isomerase RpiA [Gammaproteobacteria bacterium]|jgi:ribose 5-phosphate isomerase A|nr:ribose-5-phosphate isomerase RpiA [Gammaproteobacteria bacterium]
MTQDANKRQAAEAALTHIKEGMALGVGTGSTVDIFIELLAPLANRLGAVVSSSERSTRKLAAVGIRTAELNSVGELDLYVDGADEATKHRHLIKGGGGALTREKIVAAASRRFICIIDDTKLVATLGRFPLPIEVIPMAQSYVARQMVKAGGQPIWRQDFVTDNGNHIIDVHNLKILNPIELETRFNQIAGVVTVGLFANRPADIVLVGSPAGVKVIQ